MFAPGAASLAKEFHITSSTVTSLTVSIYLAGFAVGPMFVAPMSELYGRLVIYHICNVLYIGFIIGCARGQNTGMFLVFRFLAGCASSGPLTVGGGTVADVVPPAQRGRVMSLFFVGPLLGPVGALPHANRYDTDDPSRFLGQLLVALCPNQLAGDGPFGSSQS
jgi:MFS family permease